MKTENLKKIKSFIDELVSAKNGMDKEELDNKEALALAMKVQMHDEILSAIGELQKTISDLSEEIKKLNKK